MVEKIITSILSLFLLGLFLLIVAGLVWDHHRFVAVIDAQTQEEIKTACSEYEMASIKNIPVKCAQYFSLTN